jgi:hypothetical protein
MERAVAFKILQELAGIGARPEPEATPVDRTRTSTDQRVNLRPSRSLRGSR